MNAHVQSIHALEAMRFDWPPGCLRLLLAASASIGPRAWREWSKRSCFPIQHIERAAMELQRKGAIRIELCAEGVILTVLPANFWRERELSEPNQWAEAWRDAGQQLRVPLSTETPEFHHALADVGAPGIPPPHQGPQRALSTPSTRPVTLDGDAHVTFKRSTFSTEDVERLNVGSSDMGDALRARVQAFVTPRDFGRFWRQPRYDEIFEDPLRAKILAASLRYCESGLKDGSCEVLKTRGAMLWEDYSRNLRLKIKQQTQP